jgi:hypothetical protein
MNTRINFIPILVSLTLSAFHAEADTVQFYTTGIYGDDTFTASIKVFDPGPDWSGVALPKHIQVSYLGDTANIPGYLPIFENPKFTIPSTGALVPDPYHPRNYHNEYGVLPSTPLYVSAYLIFGSTLEHTGDPIRPNQSLNTLDLWYNLYGGFTPSYPNGTDNPPPITEALGPLYALNSSFGGNCTNHYNYKKLQRNLHGYSTDIAIGTEPCAVNQFQDGLQGNLKINITVPKIEGRMPEPASIILITAGMLGLGVSRKAIMHNP